MNHQHDVGMDPTAGRRQRRDLRRAGAEVHPPCDAQAAPQVEGEEPMTVLPLIYSLKSSRYAIAPQPMSSRSIPYGLPDICLATADLHLSLFCKPFD